MKIDGRLDDASGHEAECEALALPSDHREQRHRGADAGEGDDELEDGAQEHAGVAAGAQDPGRIALQGAVEASVGMEMKVIR